MIVSEKMMIDQFRQLLERTIINCASGTSGAKTIAELNNKGLSCARIGQILRVSGREVSGWKKGREMAAKHFVGLISIRQRLWSKK